ncbi:MAG TPA: IS1595 family transposase [Candidatus Binatia bacterium]|nr:IS1595 family transposase [Candidatus Binatia bacterium]
MNLIDVTKTFATEEQCLAFLEHQRWPNGVRCMVCGNDKISRVTRKSQTKNKRGQIYQCLEPTCKHQFSATTGTLFGDSHIPLQKWFMALAILVDAKKSISANQLKQHLGLGSYRTAWYMVHRIRKAMADSDSGLLGGIGGTVEIDETYVGGRIRGKGNRAGMANKKVVMGAVQRGGELRLRHVADDTAATFRDFIGENLSPETKRVMTDQHKSYPPALKALKPRFMVTHETVNHIAHEYVRGDVTTNSIESAFSLLKRGMIGSFHKVSIKHLHRYLSEFEYRFNARKQPDRFTKTLARMAHTKTMPYCELIAE